MNGPKLQVSYTSYFNSNKNSSNFCTNYFQTPLFEVKADKTRQENYLHIVHNL